MIGEKSKPKKRSKMRKGKGSKTTEPESVSELYTGAELVPFVRITKDRQEYVQLKDHAGFIQLMEITGKDLNSLGSAEVQRTLVGFYDWLTKFNTDFEFYTTKLPTNTSNQVAFQKRCLMQVRRELNDVRDPRLVAQLQDRERILMNAIGNEDQIKNEIYNAEFILILFGKTPADLDASVQKAADYGGGQIRPQVVSHEKKIQILKQYNNMGDKL